MWFKSINLWVGGCFVRIIFKVVDPFHSIFLGVFLYLANVIHCMLELTPEKNMVWYTDKVKAMWRSWQTTKRAFGGWHSCFVCCNSIWTWLVLLPPVGLLAFCWHFAVICTPKSGPFSTHQKCFYAHVSGCLWCLPSAPVKELEQGLCSGAKGGKACFVPEAFFSEGENTAQRLSVHTQIHINIHTTTSVFPLSSTPGKKRAKSASQCACSHKHAICSLHGFCGLVSLS